MTLRQASESIGYALDVVSEGEGDAQARQALILAKQALDILATLEEWLGLNERITISNSEYEWRATRGNRTHLGSDITDALGQLCTTLVHEKAE